MQNKNNEEAIRLESIAEKQMHTKKSFLTVAAVLVAAIGYFVDIYDLLLFSIVRTPN